MLTTFSALLYSDLSGYAPLTSLLTKGVNGIRPLMAEYDDGESFVTYTVKSNGLQTKGSVYDWQVQMWCWAKDYDASIAIADKVVEAVEAGTGYYAFVSAQPNFNEQGEIYTEIIFNIKK